MKGGGKRSTECLHTRNSVNVIVGPRTVRVPIVPTYAWPKSPQPICRGKSVAAVTDYGRSNASIGDSVDEVF